MRIDYDIVACPLGRALLAATSSGVCAVEFGDSDAGLDRGLKRRFPRAEFRRTSAGLGPARAWLRRALSGKPAGTPPVDVRATGFQSRVWAQLRAIPRGATRSYGEIARRLGRPTAARAVARACASNPLALLVPCHRVVAADGRLTGYRWGLERKQALLTLERRP